jgi:hypothetical protein
MAFDLQAGVRVLLGKVADFIRHAQLRLVRDAYEVDSLLVHLFLLKLDWTIKPALIR